MEVIGEWGNTHRNEGKIWSRVRLLESVEYLRELLNLGAESPRPWRNTTVWVCVAEAGTTRGGSGEPMVFGGDEVFDRGVRW